MSVLSRATAAPSPAQLGALLDSADEALALVDSRHRVAYCNPAAMRLFGCAPAQGLDRAFTRVTEPLRSELHDALVGAAGAWRRDGLLADGQSVQVTVSPGPGGMRILRARHAESARPSRPPAEAGTGAAAPAERSLRELGRWFELSPVGMLVYAEDGRVLRSNPAFASLVGEAPARVPDAAPELRELLGWGDAPAGADDVSMREVWSTLRAADGRSVRLRARLQPFRADGGPLHVMAVVEDRSVEDERDLAQLEIGALIDTAGVGVATYEASRGWLSSRSAAPAGGATPSQSGPQPIRREQVDPASLADFERLQRALRHGERAQVRYQVQVPELGRRWLMTRVEPGELAGGRAALSVVTLDVTEQEESHRRAEQLLRELSAILDGASAGMAYLRSERLVRCNPRFAAMLGRAPASLTGCTLDELFAGHEALLERARRALAEAGRFEAELELDGRWYALSVRRSAAADDDDGLICSYVDIDELRNAREALQLQAERTRAILDSVLVGIITVGDNGIEWMNRSARRMCGGELAEFAGMPIGCIATDEPDHPLRASRPRRALGPGPAETFECRLRGGDGREFWVVGNAVVTGSHQVTYALLDIERRRQAEISIAQAQESLQRIIETAPLAIALFDAASARVLRLNAMACQFFGQPADALLGRAPEQWFGAEEAVALRADLRQALAGRDVLRREQQRPSDAGGPLRTWDTRIVSIGATGEPQLLLVATDVTEQRAAEKARYDAAVSQREMLIKEVHHRIKNNLQGVAGLLQQGAARRPEVAALIGEVVGQVQAIAQVHGLQVGASGPLQIRPLLEAITGAVHRNFGRPIAVELQGSPAHRYALPEAESIPIALTINELLTNAIKHSAPGPIVCRLSCSDDEVSIAVSSPGRLPAGFDLAQVPPGISGLGLVRALLPRRSATLVLEQHGHTVRADVRLRPPGFSLLETV